MSAQLLLIDRIEFSTIKVEAREGEFSRHEHFPQLEIDPAPIKFFTRSDLAYPDDELDDPRHFILTYGVRVHEDEPNTASPYNFEVEAIGYFRYVGNEEFTGAERFRAVRFSGYQVLYGAIREMVANLTARGPHGIWHLPARNFGVVAKDRADDDEKERLAAIEARAALPVKKPRKKIASKKAAEKKA